MEEAVKKEIKNSGAKDAAVKEVKETKANKEEEVAQSIKIFRKNIEAARTSPADKVEAQKKKGKFNLYLVMKLKKSI